MPRDGEKKVQLQIACRYGDTSPAPHPVPGARGVIDVSEFLPGQPIILSQSRVFLRAAGAALSTLLHLAILATAIWPSSRVRAHPPEEVTAYRRQGSDEVALEWVNINESPPSNSSPQASWPVLPQPHLTSIAPTAHLAVLAANFPDEMPGNLAPSAPNDGDASARLFGQYMGQINARIDRVWTRPQTPIGAISFLCQVSIEQDATGKVGEVTLEHCNGSPRWQRSLIDAIDSASPLPAPADPAVFSRSIHLTFRAEASADEVMASQADSTSSVQSSNYSVATVTRPVALRQIRDSRAHAGNPMHLIDLRIEGHGKHDEHASVGEPHPSE